jgi:hypothetical protein
MTCLAFYKDKITNPNWKHKRIMVNNTPKWITVHKPSGSMVWETNEDMASSHNRPHGITADRLEEGRGTRT